MRERCPHRVGGAVAGGVVHHADRHARGHAGERPQRRLTAVVGDHGDTGPGHGLRLPASVTSNAPPGQAMRTTAVLPVKSFPRAKSRTRLEDPQRATLAEAMVGDVLAALAEVPALHEVLVVTRDERAADAARKVGAVIVHDPAEAGHNPAATRGASAAVDRGAERVLLVPGDCPGLDPAEVGDLLKDPAPGLTIVADRHGSGTNALLIAPPLAMAPSFGPGSF